MKTNSLIDNKRSTRSLFLDNTVAAGRDLRELARFETHGRSNADRLSNRIPKLSGRTILVAVDLTEPSSTVLNYAAMLAENCNASIVLLHAVERVYGEAFLDGPAKRGFKTELHHLARVKLGALTKPISKRLLPIRRVVRHGAPEYEILRTAKTLDADLIVLGRRRRNALSRLVFGSVTHSVIDAAPCPVVVVPIPSKR